MQSPRLPEGFHAQMVAMYSSAPTGAAARPFSRKHVNIMDPLASTNNLGRSVSRASYLRMRGALKRGAATLAAAAAEVCSRLDWQCQLLVTTTQSPEDLLYAPKARPCYDLDRTGLLPAGR